ncbi:hypothetical protein BX600DRAFT_497735 [Xylariales sp. PMI_506]|nr:hypothetical protein BX600DRAFT_497735 [Xylariales sp. PMI_506]
MDTNNQSSEARPPRDDSAEPARHGTTASRQVGDDVSRDRQRRRAAGAAATATASDEGRELGPGIGTRTVATYDPEPAIIRVHSRADLRRRNSMRAAGLYPAEGSYDYNSPYSRRRVGRVPAFSSPLHAQGYPYHDPWYTTAPAGAGQQQSQGYAVGLPPVPAPGRSSWGRRQRRRTRSLSSTSSRSRSRAHEPRRRQTDDADELEATVDVDTRGMPVGTGLAADPWELADDPYRPPPPNRYPRRWAVGGVDEYGDERMAREPDPEEALGGEVFSFKLLRPDNPDTRDEGDSSRNEDESEGSGVAVASSSGTRSRELVATVNAVATTTAATAAAPAASTTAAIRPLWVSASQYTGDGFADGKHSGRLTVLHTSGGSPGGQRGAAGQQPLFRWLHLQQAELNLDELSAEIARVPGLTTVELHGLSGLLSQARSTVKTRRTADGRNVKHMTPGSIRVHIAAPEGGSGSTSTGRMPGAYGKAGIGKRPITWLCIPYFSLEKYCGLMSASDKDGFPTETLLQSDYAPTDRPRDMEQVVVRSGAAAEGQCFHVAQLWCIVLDDSLIVTCSRMPAASLRGDVLKIITQPPMASPLKERTVYVSYYTTVLWALPLEECMTWFAFVSHFHEFWPQSIRFHHRDIVVTEVEWPRIIKLVKHSTARITLDLRLSPLPPPPTPGVLRPLIHGSNSTKDQSTLDIPQKTRKRDMTKLSCEVNDTFHVFSWLDIVQPDVTELKSTDKSPAAAADLDALAITKQLQEIDDYLGGSTAMAERRVYNSCQWSTRARVHAYLQTRGQSDEVTGDDQTEARRDYEERVDIYNAADIIYRFFLPWRFDPEAPTVVKYWGAIQDLVEVATTSSFDAADAGRNRWPSEKSFKGVISQFTLQDVRVALRGLTRVISAFQAIMSHVPDAEREQIRIPDGLVRAWAHLVMALVQVSQAGQNWQQNMELAETMITEGLSDIMSALQAPDLIADTVLEPLHLASLLSWKLWQEAGVNSLSLSDLYSDYIKHLNHKINRSPDRSLQYVIGQLKNEIEIIRQVIAYQQSAVVGMQPPKPSPVARADNKLETRLVERAVYRNEMANARVDAVKAYPRQAQQQQQQQQQQQVPYDPFDAYGGYGYGYYKGGVELHSGGDLDDLSRLSPTDPGGLADLFARDCRSMLERLDGDFYEFEIEASRLEVTNTTNIDITKDRQEKAVYAFTMVTIVFLPLSTVSSIFGMNTSDIANMELGQWVYWATAVPTTIAVIVGGLWWMGEFDGLIRWALEPRRQRKRQQQQQQQQQQLGQGQGQRPGRQQQRQQDAELVPKLSSSAATAVPMGVPPPVLTTAAVVQDPALLVPEERIAVRMEAEQILRERMRARVPPPRHWHASLRPPAYRF